MLIRRQQADKFRKSELRRKLQNKKESYIGNSLENELDFPKISNSEMKVLKNKIRNEYKKHKIRNFIVNSLLFILALAIMFYVINLKFDLSF